MNHQVVLTFILFGAFMLAGLFSCSNRHSFYTGTFRGEPYELVSIETKGFSTNHIDYAIKLGQLKQVEINPETTNWGPPYADELYGSSSRVYTHKNHIPYSNEPDNAVSHPSTMLYLSPTRFSKEDFTHYAAFMQSEWPRIDDKFSHAEYSRFPHIIGLVYGEQADFVRVFRGRKEGKLYEIKVETDGRIRYAPVTDWPNDEYSGLAVKVRMPGKIIDVATGHDAGLTLAQLQTYKDAAGKTLGDYFQLNEKP